MEKQRLRKDFRVIIVGGSIAGLTLAHALRKYKIDYVVLESHGDIAPQVGASIGFLATGCAVLDQLGVFEDIRKEIEPHGYPISFLDRQKVLAVLYDHLAEDQSKVRLNAKAIRIEHTETSAIVHCADGSEWTGDIVVGADGVHSLVRNEMWNRMEKQQLGRDVAREKAEMISEYSCVFGISTATGNLKPGDMHRTYSKDFSTLTIVGKNGRVFWFFFAKMDRKYTIENVPRFTSEDREKHIAQYLHISISSDVTFRDIYKNVISTAYVPLEEAFYKHWVVDRMVCIGDSIHKMTPNMGQGGNSAVESAASLANCFKTFIDVSPDSSYTLNDLRSALSAWSTARKRRAKDIWGKANDLTRLEAWATPKHKFLACYLLPYLTPILLDRASVGMIGSEVLEYIPVTKTSQECPIPADRRYRRITEDPTWKRLLWSLPLVMCFVGACISMDAEPVKELAKPMIDRGVFEASNGEVVKLLRPVFNSQPLDYLIGVLVTCFLPSISGSDPIARLQMLSFLMDLGPLYGIWLLESYRRTHNWTGVLLPTLMGIGFQLKGIGKIAPIYFLLDYLRSPLRKTLVANRASVRLSAVKTLLPALVLGYYVPSWACFVAPTLSDKQLSNIVWQFFPLLVPAAHIPLLAFARIVSNSTSATKKRRPDMPYIRWTIVLLTTISGVAFLYARLSAPSNASLSDIFLPSVDYSAPVYSFAEAINRFLQYDELFAMASALTWALLSFRDLQVYGFGISLLKVASVLAATTVALGPGAAFAVGWAWREEYLASIRS
ncbi:hypothetical protein BDV59DRAFT_209334 [Aspergillus ambiguus]|uniref:FAD-dependent oxidoreductase n=1 Tax=Aspergillus ambiguus TaxID=176160 RepID=UPI003CCD0B50